MVTLSDIAKAVGVSRSAVSKALLGGGGKTTQVSEKTIERIRQSALRMGYRPNLLAQRLASRRHDIIGLIVDSQCCVLYTKIMCAIEELVCRAGYRLQVGLVHDNLDSIKRYVDDLLGYNIQNVICLAHYYDFGESVPPLFRPFRNSLFISKPMTDEKFSFVSPDYYATFRNAADYLLGLGRRRIVFVKTVYQTFDAQMREQAFRDAYRLRGVPFEESFIYRGPVYELDKPELMTRLLDDILPLRPDALILGSAEGTLLALRHLKARGLTVPADISIIGMDEWPGCDAMMPSITVMNNNQQQIAEAAVKAILSNIDRKTPQLHEIFVPGSLRIGESCAPVAVASRRRRLESRH